MLAESLQGGATVHILGPAGHFRDEVIYGQGHAANQKAAAHALPQGSQSLPSVQVHNAGQQLEGMQMVASRSIVNLALPSQHYEWMA